MTRQLDLADKLAELEDKIATIEETQEDLLAEIGEKYDSYNDVPPSVEDKFDDLESGRVEAQGRVDALREIVDEHDDTTFTIRQLTGGEVANIRDQVSQESFEFDATTGDASGVPKSGYGEILWVRKAVVQAPDWLEDTTDGARVVHENDPANLPWQVFQILSDAVNAFNTTGDTEMGNSSLRDRMTSTDSSRKPSTEDSIPTTSH